jgi:hypothetical protein
MISKSQAWLFAVLMASDFGVAELAFAAADFRLERISPREMHLALGQSGTYVLRIRNVGDENGVARLGTNPVEQFLGDPNYMFTQSGSSACGDFGSEWAEFNAQRTIFVAGPIAPGGSLDCAMTIFRGFNSWSDRFLSWMVRDEQYDYPIYINPTDEALLGTLTDVSVSTQSFGFHIDEQGYAHSTIQLEVRNAGTVPVREQIAGYCEDHSFRPFLTDGSGPGGCGVDDYSPSCFDWGYGFAIPPIEAGTTYRCLIRLQSVEPYDRPRGYSIAVELRQYEAENQHWLIDTNQQNNSAVLWLQPNGAVATVVPSATRLGLLVLALLAVVAAALRIRRVSRRAMP